MIDEEIKIIIHNILFDLREISKYLKNMRTGKYNPYLENLIDFALGTEEQIQTIEQYIYALEIKLYELLKVGDNNE